jgi:hypothetical protein
MRDVGEDRIRFHFAEVDLILPRKAVKQIREMPEGSDLYILSERMFVRIAQMMSAFFVHSRDLF